MVKNKKEKRVIWLRDICLTVISGGTFLILFTPLILNTKFFFPFVGPKSLYFMAVAEIIFFAWLVLITFTPEYRPRLNPILGSLLLFLMILIVASALGVDPLYSFWSKFERMSGILMMFHLLAFFLVISTTFEIAEWRRIFVVSLLVGVIIAIISLVSENPSMRGGATIGNDSFLGTYLLFNLFLAIYLILKDEFRNYSVICLLIMGGALFLSGARAAKISFFGGMILFFFLWLACHKTKKVRLVGISLLIFSLIGGIYFAFSVPQPESFVRKQIIEKTLGETFGGRFIVWQKAWENFLDRPLLGWGPENFEFAFSKNYNPCFGTPRCGEDVWYDRAHNIIFDTLVTSGVLGILTYFGLFISAFYVLWKNYRKENFDFWITSTFSVLLISYSVQNLTVFDMVSSYMMFFLILGFIGSMGRQEIFETEGKQVNLFLGFLGVLFLILFAISFTKFVLLPLQTDFYTISALRAEPFSEERLSFYKKSLTLSPVGKYQITEFFVDTSVGSLSDEAQSERVLEEFEFLAQELEKNINDSPLNFRSSLKLGQLYNVYWRFDSAKLQDAERILEKAIELSPVNQQAYFVLAQTKLYQGRPQEALDLAEKAVELETGLIRSHIIVIEVAKITGNFELVEKKIQEAIAINSAWEETLRGI